MAFFILVWKAQADKNNDANKKSNFRIAISLILSDYY